MPGLTPIQKAQRDWGRLVDKLSSRALHGKGVLLMPNEVQVLVASMTEVTTQAMLLQKVIQKYPELWNNLVESLSVDVPGAGEDSDGDRGDHQVDPEDLHNTLTPERPGPVAGGTYDQPF